MPGPSLLFGPANHRRVFQAPLNLKRLLSSWLTPVIRADRPLFAIFALLAISSLHATESSGDAVQNEITRLLRQNQPDGVITVFTLVDPPLKTEADGKLRRISSAIGSKANESFALTMLDSAQSDDDAANIVRAAGVTHIALARVERYGAEFSRRTKPALLNAAPQTTFAQRLRARTTIPVWLEPILYRPSSLQSASLASCEISLFKVNFHQTPAEAFYRLGLLMASKGNDDAALANFTHSAQLKPENALVWLRRAELLLRQHRASDALESFTTGIQAAPKSERYKLYTQTGLAFESMGEIKIAIALYRKAVGEDMTNTIALNNLAWRLSTSRDAAIRDPRLALSFAQAADLAEPDSPENLDTLAAALAENGRFEEAVSAAQRAVDLARQAGDEAQAKLCAEHASAYQNRRPWRQ